MITKAFLKELEALCKKHGLDLYNSCSHCNASDHEGHMDAYRSYTDKIFSVTKINKHKPKR